MSLILKINNLNNTQFSINNGQPLNKGVYIHTLNGDKLGLINKHTKSVLIEPTLFNRWAYSDGSLFTSLSNLVNYLEQYIEVTGNLDPVVQPSFETQLFDKIDSLISLLEQNNTLLEQNNTLLTQIETNTEPKA